MLDIKHHKIWITRPKLDAHNQIEALAKLGIQSYAHPLLHVDFFDVHIDTKTQKGYQAVVFTSANGVRAYVENEGDKTLPVFAVGDVTTETARENGFKTIYTAKGDVLSLADMIREKSSAQDGAIYHPASTVVARDLGTILADYGYTVKRDVVYNVEPCTTLSQGVLTEIQQQNIKGVILMSPRTAGIFMDMVQKYNINIQSMHIFTLSKAIADKIPSDHPHIHIAHTPTFTQLLRHIKREYNIHEEHV